MIDKELLELAAKAAGVDLSGGIDEHGEYEENWSPLTDDGDALRLAVKLHFWIKDFAPFDMYGIPGGAVGMIEIWLAQENDPIYVEWYKTGDDRYAATRRAIVRAAAEIGKGLK